MNGQGNDRGQEGRKSARRSPFDEGKLTGKGREEAVDMGVWNQGLCSVSRATNVCRSFETIGAGIGWWVGGYVRPLRV